MTENKPVKSQAARSARELSEDTYSPLVDIYETDSELVVVAELPGVTREDVSIEVDKGVLTLEAEAKIDEPGKDYVRTYVSFGPGRYFRAFALSDEIDREKIAASMDNGVLTVHLPKAPAARSRRIEIKTP